MHCIVHPFFSFFSVLDVRPGSHRKWKFCEAPSLTNGGVKTSCEVAHSFAASSQHAAIVLSSGLFLNASCNWSTSKSHLKKKKTQNKNKIMRIMNVIIQWYAKVWYFFFFKFVLMFKNDNCRSKVLFLIKWNFKSKNFSKVLAPFQQHFFSRPDLYLTGYSSNLF